MNCSNCGAPLQLVAGRDHFCCDFCGTLNFPTALADAIDGVKPLGAPADNDCPVCATKLEHASINGARVTFCHDCRGVLADSETFAHVVRTKRKEYGGTDVTPAPLDRSQFDRQLSCPSCYNLMETHAYFGPGNAVIDSCARCKVIWVDHGEIAAIEQAPGRR